MGHIQLRREADLVVVCPATADLLAKMAAGIADDLATTLLLATDKPVLAAPAMNVRMWQHAATRRNVARLRADGVTVLEPDEGEMACGEYGPGRLPEPEAILAAIEAALGGAGPARRQARHRHRRPDPRADRPGPGHRQPLVGQAGLRHRRRARRARRAGDAGRRPGVARHAAPASPGSMSRPRGRWTTPSSAALPADAAVLVAAVADWRVEPAPAKLKKDDGPPALDWQRNPDILADLAAEPAPAAACWSASPPRPTTSKRRPRPSAAARAATGSSPTTCRAT